MAVSRRALVMSMFAAGLLPGCKSSQELLGEPFPVYEDDAQRIAPEFRRTTVDYRTKEPKGTIVVDTGQRFLYHVQGGGQATRYGVGVGRAGRDWFGEAVVARKAEWPVWVPTREHLAEFPKHARYINGMPGGKGNPMGARALYLHQGEVDTQIRIHGAILPSMIGKRSTAGCISLLNIDVIHLYDRVEIGARTVILPPNV
ncbi:MAG: L,D-transpeptidase [Rhizobiales bacterium]|nr:L,D-transpeptidase [Hyphomicrobiales bacterium]